MKDELNFLSAFTIVLFPLNSFVFKLRAKAYIYTIMDKCNPLFSKFLKSPHSFNKYYLRALGSVVVSGDA